VKNRLRLGVVVQRYGQGITGGSESLARAVSERLAGDFDVSVFTSCASDYVTWRNDLPAGETPLGGVRVRRFPSTEERDLPSFNRYAEPLYGREASEEEQQEFLRRQGPFVPGLVEAIGRERESFDAFLFFTYLYYPTVAGLLTLRERSVLVPTAHDEPPLRLPVFKRAFAAAQAFAFCSRPEEALVRSRFPLGEAPSAVTGIGIEEEPADGETLERHGLPRPFAIYAGRIDEGKGCLEMLEGYRAYRAQRPDGIDLVLIGTLAMARPEGPGVRYLGFVGDAEKAALMGAATAVLCPSAYESLSITLLEGFVRGTPGLGNAHSPVLKDHCIRSNAGLYYKTRGEFVSALDLLSTNAELRSALGANGRAYVARDYTWSVVLARYRGLIEAVARPT
jgi:glycosyltransferase involved in cell wall biosynthesis